MSGPKCLEFRENAAARARLEQAQRQQRCTDLRKQIADFVAVAEVEFPQGMGQGAAFWKQQLQAAQAEQDDAVLQRQLQSLRDNLAKAREHALRVREQLLRRQLETDAWRQWATATQTQQREILASFDALGKLQAPAQRADLLTTLESQLAKWQQRATELQDQICRREMVLKALAQALGELGATLVISDEVWDAYQRDPAAPLDVAAYYPDGGEERLSLPLSLQGVVRTPDSRTDNHEYILALQRLLRTNAGIEMNFKSIEGGPGPDRDKTAKPLPGGSGQQRRQAQGG
ncbi:MAG: hypothetical protein ACK5TX_13655 [Planctomyces sp.]|jgi:hypothetical protein